MPATKDGVSAAARSLGSSSTRLVRHFLALFATRAELALIELQEERDRALAILALAVASALAAAFAWFGVNALAVYALWPYSPFGALAGVTVLHAFVAWGLRVRLARIVREARPFEATLAEFEKDRRALGLDT